MEVIYRCNECYDFESGDINSVVQHVCAPKSKEFAPSASPNKQITKPCPFYVQSSLCRLSGVGEYYCGDLPCQLSGKAS